MRHLAVLTLCILASTGIALAQGLATFRGTLHAWHGTRPVPNARVSIRLASGGTIATTSDAHGAFALLGVPPGKALLTVEADGYSPTSIRLCVHPDETRFLPLRLISAGSIPQLTEVVRYNSAVANGVNRDTAANVYYVGC